MDYFATEIKLAAVSTNERIISGWAAHHHTIDRVKDIIDPVASQKAVARLKAPSDVGVFIAHQATLPVGIPLKIEATSQGLYTETYILKGATGDNLLAIAKDLLDHGMTLGLSIGYKTHDSRREQTAHGSVRRLLDYSLAEYSFASHQAVANPSATMLSVKSHAEAAARRAQKALSAGTDTAGGALVPADQSSTGRGGAGTMQYRVEQQGDRWVVYCDWDADGDADDNVPVGTYASAEIANAVVLALRKQQQGYGDTDDDAPDGGGGDVTMDGKAAASTQEVKAEWSTAYVNDLPNSSFLYVEPGEDDEEGKRVPRSKRHLPYKDSGGAIDLPHLRNAIARIPQMDGIGADKKAQLQARARRMLATSDSSDGKVYEEPLEWKDGAPVTVAAVAYQLLDLAEAMAADLKAMVLLGEEVKAYQRIREPRRTSLLGLAKDLRTLAEWAETIDKGEDTAQRLAWYRRRVDAAMAI